MTQGPSDRRTAAGTIAIGAVAVLCCAAGKLLLAAGVLGTIGAFLAEPAVLAVAGALGVLAAGWLLRRRTRRTAGDDSPTDHTPR